MICRFLRGWKLFSALIVGLTLSGCASLKPSPLPPPSAPSLGRASPSQVNLNWASPEGVEAVVWHIQRNGRPLRQVVGNGTADAGLKSTGSLCYAVAYQTQDGRTSPPSLPVCLDDVEPSVPKSWLSDTGQTNINSPLPGEDADYLINPPNWTLEGQGAVRDDRTGLLWQRQDDGQFRNWPDASDYCQRLELEGRSDWRLPERMELLTLTYYPWTPAIAVDLFPETQMSYYWSASMLPGRDDYAYEVHFNFGDSGSGRKDAADGLSRCVAGERLPEPDYIDNGDGTVSDLSTGLIWQQGSSLGDWPSALAACEALDLAGYLDWRLPNLRELASLARKPKAGLAIDKQFFPATEAEGIWSSTSYQLANPTHAFVLYPENAYIGGHRAKDYPKFSVRCVRGGAVDAPNDVIKESSP